MDTITFIPVMMSKGGLFYYRIFHFLVQNGGTMKIIARGTTCDKNHAIQISTSLLLLLLLSLLLLLLL